MDHTRKASSPYLPVARVKAIARQDEAVGKMTVEATSVIARCADAFLADLILASADVAKDAGVRKSESKGCKQQMTRSRRQVLPEDVRAAAAKEERFDFLRPVLDDLADDRAPASAPKGAKRNRSDTAGNAGSQPRIHNTPQEDIVNVAGGGMASFSGILPGSIASSIGKGTDIQTLAGMDEESRRAAVLGGADSMFTTVSGVGDDDDDDDYDNC